MHYSICSCSHQAICGLWRPVKALQHDCCFVASFMFDFARHETFCGTVCFAFQCLSVPFSLRSEEVLEIWGTQSTSTLSQRPHSSVTLSKWPKLPKREAPKSLCQRFSLSSLELLRLVSDEERKQRLVGASKTSFHSWLLKGNSSWIHNIEVQPWSEALQARIPGRLGVKEEPVRKAAESKSPKTGPLRNRTRKLQEDSVWEVHELRRRYISTKREIHVLKYPEEICFSAWRKGCQVWVKAGHNWSHFTRATQRHCGRNGTLLQNCLRWTCNSSYVNVSG